MNEILFMASVSGHYVKEFQTFVGRGGIIGLKREIYIKLSKALSSNQEASTMIRVDDLFRGWFNWTALNEHRIRMIIESIHAISKDRFFVVGSNSLPKDLKDVLFESAKKVLKNHDYPLDSPKKKPTHHSSTRNR